jgi:RNA polymerase sigma factor (TIGR02999 family)
MPNLSETTRLLKAWSAGDQSALDRLVPKVYDELRRTAHRQLKKEQSVTLQTTELVNETYLRLVDVKNVGWQDRAHFFAVASQMMRRLLVDAARKRASLKRGGHDLLASNSAIPNFDQIPDLSSDRDRELLAIDAALEVLATIDARKVRVIELRFFGGLTVEKVAEVLRISPQSVMRDWKLAKAWIRLRTEREGAITSSRA